MYLFSMHRDSVPTADNRFFFFEGIIYINTLQ